MSVTNASKRKRPTSSNYGAKLHEAIKAQQRAELRAAKGRRRTPEQWQKEYDEAMMGKRTSQYLETKREDGEPHPRWVQQKLKL